MNYVQSQAQALHLVTELTGMGAPAMAVQADVADREQVRKMVDTV